ncbi:hypothetical protein D3C79_664160 [compost metagenome]
MKVAVPSTTPPILSAITSQDQPVNSVSPAAHTHNNASVAPMPLNHGSMALLSKLPITPPEAK